MQTACVNERREKRNEIKKELETMGCGRSCDVSGSKPLLYHLRGGTLAFADDDTHVIGEQSDTTTDENNSYKATLPGGDDTQSDTTENIAPAAQTAGEQCANGHTWGNGTVTMEATCTEAGKKTKTCSVCGAEESEEIPALEHSYGEDGKSTICGAEQEATQETIQECEHDWSDWTVTIAATCTTDGEQTRTCSVCPESETKVINAAGHTWDNGTVTTEATCTEKGEKTYTCSACEETKTEEIEALGHDYVDGVCAICGATKPETEDPTGDPAVEGEQETPEHKAAIEAINALDDYISEIDEFLLSVTNEDGEIVGNDEYDADAAYAKLQEMLSNGLAMYDAIPLDGVELTADEENLLAGLKAALDGISGIMPIADAVAQIGDTTYETLSAAVAAATAGQTVKLLADTKEDITISTSITLDLNGHTLTGTGSGSVITDKAASGTVTIKNGTITGGKTSDKGAGIKVTGKAALELNKVTMTSNSAKLDGGAVYTSSALTITDCTFESNSGYRGGAISSWGSTLTVNGTNSFKNNSALKSASYSADGGAIYCCNDTSVVISGSSFEKNYANGNGGAIAIKSCTNTVSIKGATFKENTSGFGGALYLQQNNDTTIENSTFTNNTATGSAYYYGYGGAILVMMQKATVSDVKITGNKAFWGGGVFIYTSGTFTADNSTELYNNEASYAGDDVYISKAGTVTLPSVGSNWVLDDCEDAIDGWYDDTYGARWKAHAENKDDNHIEAVEANSVFSSAKGIIAAHGVKTEEEDPTTPDPEPEEETPSNPSGGGSTTITDPETPTTETPEDVTEIEEEDTPLADAEEVTVIEDEETALADVPQTGDSTDAWNLMAAFSALGLVWLAIDSKKRKAAESK